MKINWYLSVSQIMVKTKVAPMNFRSSEKRYSTNFNTHYVEVVDLENDVNTNQNLKIPSPKILFKDNTFNAKQKWSNLRNTLRLKSALVKGFHRKNGLTTDKIFSSGDCKDFSAKDSCLLDNLDKYEDVKKEKRRIKRGSIENRKHSRILIKYFSDLANIEKEEQKLVDFQYLSDIFVKGVDINTTDRFGQSVMHEVARVWHTDVARFLLLHGAVVNQPDDFGRTPLHVASAVNFPEMVSFLLENGADINAETYGEKQKAIHYAAKNDTVDTLIVLIHHGGSTEDVDYKGRTPLQLAAELDRSETAKYLIDIGASAGVYDNSKMAAMTLLIEKMHHVALSGLDQFHDCNRALRNQYFFLNFLVPPTENEECYAKSPLEVAVENQQFQILLHPVMKRLIKIKWQKFGFVRSIRSFILNSLLCVIWTALLCTMPPNQTKMYAGNRKYWGPLFEAIAVTSLMVNIYYEVKDFLKSQSNIENYKKWRRKELERDLKYCHDKWPDEKIFIDREIKELQEQRSSYHKDKWNIFDWVTYILMALTILFHLLNISNQTHTTNHLIRGFGSAMMVSMWLRLLKYARPFKSLGIFVIMISHVINDTLKILFLAMHIFIPYIASFWINFGIYSIKGFTMDYLELFYNLFQMALVGDFQYENIDIHSKIMAQLLCGSYIFLGGIVCINLFIALMSNTFQRVYDNAKANALMQCAAAIVRIENNLSYKKLVRHREWMNDNCAPESIFYDDDDTDPENSELMKTTHKINEKIDKLNKLLDDKNFDKEINSMPKTQIENQTAGNFQRNFYTDNNKVERLVNIITDFKSEYTKSAGKTRIEIAGLGLLLKDLIEKNELLSQNSHEHICLNFLDSSSKISSERKRTKSKEDHVTSDNKSNKPHQDNINLQNTCKIGNKYDGIMENSINENIANDGIDFLKNNDNLQTLSDFQQEINVTDTKTVIHSETTSSKQSMLQQKRRDEQDSLQQKLKQQQKKIYRHKNGMETETQKEPYFQQQKEIKTERNPSQQENGCQTNKNKEIQLNEKESGKFDINLHNMQHLNFNQQQMEQAIQNQQKKNQKNQKQKTSHSERESQEFFEGYTFQDSPPRQHSTLIQSKWSSIFSHLISASKRDKDDLEHSVLTSRHTRPEMHIISDVMEDDETKT